MRRAWSRLVTVLCAAVAFLAGPRAWGEVTAHVEAPTRVYVADSAQITVVVQGARSVPAPDLSMLADFDVVYQGAGQSISIENGVTRVSIGHNFGVVARRAGVLEFPPITVVADGKAYTTTAVSIEAIEPKAADGFTLQVAADHTRAFVGQPVLVKLSWTIPAGTKDVSGVRVSMRVDGVDHELMLGPQTRPLNQASSNGVVVPLDGEQVMGAFDGHTLSVDRVIVPKASGKITIGPARIDFQRVVGFRTRTIRDSVFDDLTVWERQFSSAAPVEIMVDDLPTAGKPADFSGLVGKYEITATADATNVSVGEPINLMVGVAGPYPPTLVPAMDFSAQRDLKSHFRVPRDPVLPQTTATAAFFQAMIRARSDSVKAIDPISISYFDPDSRKYKVAKTNPLPIIVKPSTTVGLPDEPDGAELEKPAGPARPGGLPDIERGPIPFVGAARMLDVREEMRSVGTFAMLAGPPVACGLVAAGMGVARWRRRDPDGARRAAAVRRFKKAVRRPRGNVRPEDALARAIANFAADWHTCPADTLTGPATAELLEAEGTEAGRTLGRIARACDAVRFAGAAGAVDVRAMGDEAVAAARVYGDELRAAAKGRAA